MLYKNERSIEHYYIHSFSCCTTSRFSNVHRKWIMGRYVDILGKLQKIIIVYLHLFLYLFCLDNHVNYLYANLIIIVILLIDIV